MKHVFWLEHYPRSISGIIDYLSTYESVTCICFNKEIYSNRSKMGWSPDAINNATLIYLQDIQDIDVFIRGFLAHHESSAHYIMGVRYGGIASIVNKYLLSHSKYHVFMIAERPFSYQKSRIRLLLLKRAYDYLGRKYQDKISAVFAMGTMGVEAYKGWAHGNVYPFVYPRFNDPIPPVSSTCSLPIHALYVGQFDRRKGVHILLEAIQSFRDEITLDLVGKNGDMENEIIDRVKHIPNANYIGVWDSNDVVRKSSVYDVCFVPSLYDGWGMFVMEALEAEVGVITTDLTGSKDMVIASQAGRVVKAGSVAELKKVIEMLVGRPSIILDWKSKAHGYRNSILKSSVGLYFKSVVNYVINKEGTEPSCPWL